MEGYPPTLFTIDGEGLVPCSKQLGDRVQGGSYQSHTEGLSFKARRDTASSAQITMSI